MKPTRLNRPHRMRRHRRRAGAIVEFAVVLPVLLTILFGIIEYGWVFMVRLTMQNAAREGCRLAVLQGVSDGTINQRIDEVMAPTGLGSYATSITHATLADPTEVVTVSIPYNDVSLMGGFFGPHDWDIVSTCSMRKEGMGQQEEDS